MEKFRSMMENENVPLKEDFWNRGSFFLPCVVFFIAASKKHNVETVIYFSLRFTLFCTLTNKIRLVLSMNRNI